MDFFYGISRNKTVESKVGTTGIELSGQDWLGLGAGSYNCKWCH